VSRHVFNPFYSESSFSYDKPPLYDVTVEEFETCALDRLRILAEIESSVARNRSWDETKKVTETLSTKYLPLHNNTATTQNVNLERKRDHLGHFVLRLAFSRS
jgi:DNA primase large subunit